MVLNMLSGGVLSITSLSFVSNVFYSCILLIFLQSLFRSLGYGNGAQKKPSQSELVAVQATAGTIAGACSSIITTPIDTIKTRLQVILFYSSQYGLFSILIESFFFFNLIASVRALLFFLVLQASC